MVVGAAAAARSRSIGSKERVVAGERLTTAFAGAATQTGGAMVVAGEGEDKKNMMVVMLILTRAVAR